MTVGSLFSGIGGFDLAAERVGWEIKWQVEIDPFCRKVLAKHWPDVRRHDDVRKVHGPYCEKTHEHESGIYQWCSNCLEPVDVICGGDPCQRNSNAWRNGGGVASPADHFIRIVEALRPRFVVRENPATVRADAPWPWWRFSGELERLGYAVLPFRLRACCVGADHARDRLFLLATFPDSDSARLEGDERQKLAHQDKGRHDADATGSNRWYAAPRVCRGSDGIPHRMDRTRALGNAIVPQIAEWIFRQIQAAEDGVAA